MEQVDHACKLASELTQRGGIETLPGGRAVPKETGYGSADESHIRAKIEAIVADGFGLEQEDILTILDDFSMKAASDSLREEIQRCIERSVNDTTSN